MKRIIMPINIKYVEDSRGVVLTMSDELHVNELVLKMSEIFCDKKYLNLKYLIGDNTDCKDYSPTSENMKSLAALTVKESLRNPKMLLAIVSPSDLLFGMSRVFLSYCSDSLFNIKLFRNRGDADNWVQNNV